MIASQVIPLILTGSALLTTAASQGCYWPDGSVAAGFQPCNRESGTGACCSVRSANDRDMCFSNGLCHSNMYGFTYRGACTTPGWHDSAGCATVLNPKTFARLTPCDDRLCCGDIRQNKDEVLACCNKPKKESFFMGNASVTNSPVTDCSQVALTREEQITMGVGLGVGVPTLLVAMAALLWKCFRRRKPEAAKDVAMVEEPVRGSSHGLRDGSQGLRVSEESVAQPRQSVSSSMPSPVQQGATPRSV